MPDKKLTDSEIVKALECCPVADDCYECECKEFCPQYMGDLIPLALDLINRQKAKNETLKELNGRLVVLGDRFRSELKTATAENERLQEAIDEQDIEISRLYKRIDEAKAEAYKEFAERLKTEYAKGMNWFKKKESYYVDVGDINNLLKELVGEDNGEEKE